MDECSMCSEHIKVLCVGRTIILNDDGACAFRLYLESDDPRPKQEFEDIRLDDHEDIELV